MPAAVTTERARLLPILAVLCVAWLLSATSAPPVAVAEIVLGGRVIGRTDEPRRDPREEVGLGGAAAELLAFRDLYQTLETTLADGRPPQPAASARTDERGFFELPAPAPGRWTLRLSAPGRAVREQTLIAYLPWEEHPAVALSKGREVAIRVLDPEGRPVAGARVVGWPEADDRHRIETGVTGDDGRLTLPAVAGRPLHLGAFAPGFAPAGELDAAEPTVVLRLRPGSPRRVEVRQGRGLPVAGALVLLGESGLPAGRTGDDGRLEILVPDGEGLTVRALAPDLRSAEIRIEPAEPKPTAPLRLDLGALPVLSGQVVDAEDRTPLAGVFLWAPDAGEALTVSDRAGGYALALPEIPDRGFRLLAVLPGYVPGATPVEPAQTDRPLPTLLLSPAAAVSGTAVDGAGEPLAGVEIRITSRTGRSSALARSGAGGRFVAAALRPGGPALLLAEKPGYAPASLDIPLLEARRTVEGVRVVLERGRPVAGRVIDRSEEPVEGAQIFLLPRRVDTSLRGRFARPQPPLEQAGALSGADGGFRVDHVGEGRYDLRVEASGFAPAEVPGIEVPGGEILPGEGPVDLGTVVLESAVRLTGRVIDPEGLPLEGVRVLVLPERSGIWSTRRFDPLRGATDAEGKFSLGDFRDGESVSVGVEHPGYASAQIAQVQVPPPEPLEIVLQPAARVSGIVRDPDGRPVEGAQIQVDASGGRGWSFGRRGSEQTDAEGRFTLDDVSPGEVTLQAWAEGFLRDALVHLEVAPGARIEGVEITLTPGATVSGRVVGPAGEPLSGARVGLLAGGDGGRFGSSVATDGDGRYQLDGVPPGTRSFTAGDNRHPQAIKDLEVRPGANRLDFHLDAGRLVSGQALDAGGRPVAGAELGLAPTTNSENRQAISRRDGSFVFEGVPDGEYLLRGSHPELGEVALGEPLAVRGADLTGVEVRFQGGATIRGRILGLSLDALASIEIRAFSDRGSGLWARPDFEGSFVLEGAAAGTWTVVAFSPSGNRVSEPVVLPEGASEAEVVLEFRSGLVISGRVLLGSEPVREGTVVVNRPGTSSSGFDAVDHEGRFRIEGLEEGTYELRIFGPRGLQHQQEVAIPTEGEILIALEAAKLTGRVLDAVTGEPLPGVVVSLSPENDGGMGRALLGGFLTDTHGVFRFGEVAAGRYRLILAKDGYSRTESPIVIDAGVSEPIDIRLEPSPGLVLQVSWAPGLTPSPWVQVTATAADGRVGLADGFPVAENGLVRLTGLPPGAWEIQVSASSAGAKVQASVQAVVLAAAPGPPVPVVLVPEETNAPAS